MPPPERRRTPAPDEAMPQSPLHRASRRPPTERQLALRHERFPAAIRSTNDPATHRDTYRAYRSTATAPPNAGPESVPPKATALLPSANRHTRPAPDKRPAAARGLRCASVQSNRRPFGSPPNRFWQTESPPPPLPTHPLGRLAIPPMPPMQSLARQRPLKPRATLA